MESIVLNVCDIDNSDRRAIEHAVGQSLRDNQRLVIQIVSASPNETTPTVGQSSAADQLPDWCNVYKGLSDQEIADLEKSIVRSHESRTFA
jgi:hypothetical protein